MESKHGSSMELSLVMTQRFVPSIKAKSLVSCLTSRKDKTTGFPFAEGWKAKKEGRRKENRATLLGEEQHIFRDMGLSFTNKSCQPGIFLLFAHFSGP